MSVTEVVRILYVPSAFLVETAYFVAPGTASHERETAPLVSVFWIFPGFVVPSGVPLTNKAVLSDDQ